MSQKTRTLDRVAKEICDQAFPSAANLTVRHMTDLRHSLYFVRVGDSSFVLKIFSDDEGALRREVVSRQLLGARLPIPPIRAEGVHRNRFFYAIMSWCDGTALARMLLRPPSAIVGSAFHDAGRLLGKLRLFSSDIAGQIDNLLPLAPLARMGFGDAGFVGRFEEATHSIAQHVGTTVYHRILGIMAEADVSVDAAPLVLSHGDFQPKNLLISPEGHVEGLIDWELAAIAPAWSDIAHLLRYAFYDGLVERLAAGYAEAASLGAGWQRAARRYDLGRISVGLSRPDLSGSDVPIWLALVRGLVRAIDEDDTTPVRRAVTALLRYESARA
jgi:aminoglycoside phosphotransferase (APT) family kinase protein